MCFIKIIKKYFEIIFDVVEERKKKRRIKPLCKSSRVSSLVTSYRAKIQSAILILYRNISRSIGRADESIIVTPIPLDTP